MIQKLTSGDYAVSAWSGGTTTQLAIYPENAVYADRDFLWRVSSATVDLEDSDFTPLPDYDRLIATLEGEIVLTHNGGAPLRLRPLEVHAFSGADATHSVGRCRDFNLMLRRGRASGTMEPFRLTEAPTRLHAGGSEFRVQRSESVGTSIACPHPTPGETFLLYCAEGSCSVGAAIGRPPEAEAFPACSAGHSFASLPADSPACSHGAPVCAAAGPSPARHSERREAESKNPAFPLSLRAGETLLCTEPIPLTLIGPATLMLCRITTR